MWTVKQATKELGISEQRLRKLLLEGRIRGIKMGRDWIVLSLQYERLRKYKGKR